MQITTLCLPDYVSLLWQVKFLVIDGWNLESLIYQTDDPDNFPSAMLVKYE